MKRRRIIMRRFLFSKYLSMVLVLLAIAGTAEAQVCIRVDETRDMLSDQDRPAVVLHLSRQFELAGKRVVPDCPAPYTVRHIRLGDVITVTLSGPEGQREGTAQGLNDLPALYSQLVRSLVTGRNIVDRSNVTKAQASASRVHTDSYFYVRLGYGGIFSNRVYGRPAFGFGHRTELDSFAIDVSFLNVQPDTHNGYSTSSATAGSLLKLEGLYFVHSRANASPYFGGGFGYGSTSVGNDAYYNRTNNQAYSAWRGSGLQGEVTAGYEIARTTTLRVFVQADASLPFYKSSSQTFSTSGVVATSQRYLPSLVFSVGLGWQRNRR
jgi:hypothetical protein